MALHLCSGICRIAINKSVVSITAEAIIQAHSIHIVNRIAIALVTP